MLTAAVPAPSKLLDRLRALLALRVFPLSASGHPQRYFKAIHYKGIDPMKQKNSLIYILAVLTALPLVGTVAPAATAAATPAASPTPAGIPVATPTPTPTAIPTATIAVEQTFDFPGTPTATLPHKISDQGDLVGTVIDANGKAQGFIYKYRLGLFSSPYQDPNDTGNFTQGRGINNKRYTCGEYLNGSDGTFHGYVLQHPDFVEFDVTGALSTIPMGINNASDIVGTAVFSNGTQPAFVSFARQGVVITFSVPDATATFACQINTFRHIVGYYIDANGIAHGYTRDSTGNLTFPIDVPGSTGTILFGNNDSDWVVGKYTDLAGATHALYFITPDHIQTFDYPGSTSTSLDGINKRGESCGYYLDSADVYHGFVARVFVGGQ